MSASVPGSYQTLRRTRALVRVLAPIVGWGLTLTGVGLFTGVAPELLSTGNSLSERLIWGLVGLVYLAGLPLGGYVLFFLLRAFADMIELWIDSTESASKTAQLTERQLVPGVLRMCRQLEQLNERLGAVRAAGAGRSAGGGTAAAGRVEPERRGRP